MADDVDRTRTRHRLLNRSVEGNWEVFSEHRAQVTRLVLNTRVRGGRLTVFGAGNCNDLDLTDLGRVFDGIELRDIDERAVTEGVRRQGHVVGRRIVVVEADVTGVAQIVDAWAGRTPTDAEIDRLVVAMREGGEGGGPADVVLSTGLLSQLSAWLLDAVGIDHPRATEVVLAVRDAHVRTLLRTLWPGGVGIVVTDLTSSRQVANLDRANAERCREIFDEVVRQARAYTGTDPIGLTHSIGQQIGSDAGVEITAPWRWDVTPSRSHLTYAATFRRPRLTGTPSRHGP
jgi:hypothetical protein